MLSARLVGIVLAVSVGTAVGLGGFTFVYGQGGSYLTNDPAACANCHVMRPQLDAWLQSSHRNVATCNDCHAPHDALGKLVTKARNGVAHSVAFTTGRYPERLRIKPYNLEVTEEACRYCHESMALTVHGPAGEESRGCVGCHNDVGHRSGAPLLTTGASGGVHNPVTNHD